jgi:drug/metabolite transporter (DMT)-like permease
MKLWPVWLAASGIVIEHILLRLLPQGISIFAVLAIAYVCAAVACLSALAISGVDIAREFSRLGSLWWMLPLLGFGVFMIESGIASGYRSGWRMGYFGLAITALSVVVLIAVGHLFLKERVTLMQAGGVLLIGAGLVMIKWE